MKKFLFASQLFVLIIFCACNSNKNVIKVLQTNFSEEIQKDSNLEFTFNKNLADENLLNAWIDEPYFIINPPISGNYKWTALNKLTFSPSTHFKGNSKYSIRLNSDFFKDNKYNADTDYEANFTTNKLKVADANLSWFVKSRNKNDAELRAKVFFNVEVKPASFAKGLIAKIGANTYKTSIVDNSFGKKVEIKIDAPLSIADKNKQLLLTFAGNYEVINSENNLFETIEVKRDIPKPGQLIISGIDAFHNGTLGEIQVNANQEVDLIGLKKLITISPKIKYNIEENTNGFKITSNEFNLSNAYTLTVSEKLKGVFNTELGNEYSSQFTFGALDPAIKFADTKSLYLNAKGNKNVAIEIVAIEEVEVKIIKVFSNNIKALYQKGKRRRYNSYYNKDTKRWVYNNYQKYETEEFGKTVYSKIIKTKSLESIGRVKLLNLAFDDILEDYTGLYIVEVNHPEKKYLTSSTLISMSDIGIIAKETEDEFYVFLNSLKTTNALEASTVTLIDQTNQQLITQTSDGDGVVVFKKKDIKMIEPNITMVHVKNGDDFNLLVLDRTEMNNSRFEIGGLRNHVSEYQAFMYAERELYRPGEKVNLAAIVRTNDLKTPKNLPFLIKCLLPNGKLFKTINKKLNENGALEASVTFGNTATTGNYQFELYTGNGLFVSSKNIKIEEFVPDRIKVSTTLNKKDYNNGDKVKLSLLAENFFGPPAKNRNYETDFTIKKRYFRAKEFSNFHFAIDDKTQFNRLTDVAKTDNKGKAEVSFTIPKAYENIGLLEGKIYTTVFDETGRPVSKINTFNIYTQKVFFGLEHFNTYRKTDENIALNFVALDKNENVLEGEFMNLKIIRHYYRTVLEKDKNGRFKYRSNRQEEKVLEKTIEIGGNSTVFNFVPKENGTYKIYYGDENATYKPYKSFYAYNRDRTSYNSFEVNREGKIDFITDKDSYEIGDQAKLILTTPFDGKVLVSLEREGILKHFYTKTSKRSAEITLDITAEMNPNVYVTATLFKSVENNKSPLTVAYGITNLTVNDKSKNFEVNIIADDKIRSNRKYNFTINTKPNTELTVAMVDEGILNITNYQSPNAYKHFYQKRALAVDAFDLYPFLFPEINDKGLLIGGGDGNSLDKRAVGFGNKRIKLTSFWSGIVQTDANGNYKMEVDIPEFSGDLRVMAVAYKDEKFGAARKNIKVADPIVVSSGIPRFLSPGDEFEIPVTFTNTTENEVLNNIKLETSDLIEIVGSNKVNENIASNDEFQTVFKAKVKQQIGEAKITATSNALSESFVQNTAIIIRPASPFQKKSGSGIIEANTTESLNFESDFIPESIDGNLIISNSPIVQFGDQLSYLIQYPHGCLEQTISKAFPLVYIEDLARDIKFDLRNKSEFEPHYLVQEAIYKVQSMQLSNGGMTYWRRSNSNVNWFASIYAAHFLTEAKKAGFDVNENVLKKLYTYMKQQMKGKQTFLYRFFGGVSEEKVSKEIIYSLFVLALGNQADIPLMNYYKSYPKKLTTDSKYMLGAAFGLLGDMENFGKLIPDSFNGKKAIGEFDGSFTSYTRDLAISLYVLVEADPNNVQIPAIARKLSKEFKERSYFNTQEAAFTLLGLGKYAQHLKSNYVTANIKLNGENFADYSGKNSLELSYKDLKNGNLTIETKGNGQLFYFWQMEGLSNKNDVEERDNFLEVRKQFFTREGKAVDLKNVKQNDLIVVKLSLRSKDKDVKNVALTDILPAGFEIENPRLSESVDLEWQTRKGSYDHIDFRDDRVNIYCTAYGNQKRANAYNYYYVVRAVSKGKFVMGVASADAMYDGEYYSYNGGGFVEIN